MARAAALRSVASTPVRRKPKPATVVGAASSGTRRDLLVALRDRIAKAVGDDCPPRDLASLSLRLLAIAGEIESIDAADKGDDVGDAAGTPDEPWPAG